MNYALRLARRDDVPAINTLFNAASQKWRGRSEHTEEQFHGEFHYVNPEADVVIAVLPDRRTVGAMFVLPYSHTTFWLWGRVHPDYEGQGIGTALMNWAETRVHTATRSLPATTTVTLRAENPAQNIATPGLLQAFGFGCIRAKYTMQIDFDATPPPTVTVPEGIRIRPMVVPDEYRAIYTAKSEAFRDHWGYEEEPEDGFDHFMADLATTHDPTLWFVAMEGNEIAGIAMCRTHSRYSAEIGWLWNLAVRRPWRKRGVGLALLQTVFRAFYLRGYDGVALRVDSGSLTNAVALYERAGMRAVNQDDIYEKVISRE